MEWYNLEVGAEIMNTVVKKINNGVHD